MNEIKLAHAIPQPALAAETESITVELRTLDDLELALASGGELLPDWP